MRDSKWDFGDQSYSIVKGSVTSTEGCMDMAIALFEILTIIMVLCKGVCSILYIVMCEKNQVLMLRQPYNL